MREFPAAVRLHAGRGRGRHRFQFVIRDQLEDAHAAEFAAAGLLRYVDEQVAVAHPGAAAARELMVENLASSLLLLGHGLQRRREESPHITASEHQQQAGHGDRAGDAPHRMPAARITVSSLPRASEPTQQRADQHGDGHRLVHLLRNVQQHEPERIERRIRALADVVLLVGKRNSAPSVSSTASTTNTPPSTARIT